MNVRLQPGRYVVAVSGGVDSVSLLHALARQPGLRLTVAHFDHGIRADSAEDRKLVQKLSKDFKLPFVFYEGGLGAGTSEDAARTARYDFLRQVQNSAGADALVTAHHQDDVLETAILNILRGTGRKGLSSLADTPNLRRPMLHVSKADVRQYAAEQGLVWREDSTNQDTTILRNYVRHVLLPKLGPEARKLLLGYLQHVRVVNRSIDTALNNLLHFQPSRQTLDRQLFVQMPHDVSLELMAAWLRSHDIRSFDRKNLERIVTHSKTLAPGKQIDVVWPYRILVGKDVLALIGLDR